MQQKYATPLKWAAYGAGLGLVYENVHLGFHHQDTVSLATNTPVAPWAIFGKVIGASVAGAFLGLAGSYIKLKP